MSYAIRFSNAQKKLFSAAIRERLRFFVNYINDEDLILAMSEAINGSINEDPIITPTMMLNAIAFLIYISDDVSVFKAYYEHKKGEVLKSLYVFSHLKIKEKVKEKEKQRLTLKIY